MADGSSKILHENDRTRGCMQRFLHFLDLHQRLRLPKTLTYPRQIPRIRVRSPKKKQNAAAFEDDRNDTEKDATSSVRSAKHGRSYTRVLVKNLIARRRSGDKDKKQSTTPSASQMKRTFSIHHMDSNDYVAQDPESIKQITTERADSVEVDSEQAIGPGSSSAHRVLPILQCTQSVGDVEFRDNSSPKKATPVSSYRFCRSRSSIDGLSRDQLHELLNLIAEGQTENDANAGTELYQSMFMDIMQKLMKNKDLFLMFLQDHSVSAKELRKSGSFPGPGWFHINSLSTIDHKETENGSIGKKQKSIQDRDSDKDNKDQKNVTTVSRHFKVLKKKIKDIIKENNKEQERISMDSIFHKIPYGEKASKIKMKETGLASTSSSNNKLKRMRKSTSLTESLGRYSQLLESVSSTDAKRSRVVESSVESISSIEAKRTSNLIKENKDAPTKKAPRALGRMFSLQDLHSYSLSKNHSQLPLKPERLEEQPMKKDGSSKIAATKEQVLPINEQKLVAYEALELSIIKDRSYCFEDDYSNDVLRTPTEILVADSRQSSETGNFFRELSTWKSHTDMVEPQIDSDIEATPRDENVDDLFDEAPSLRAKKHGSFHIQVDEMNETEFEYVRNILLKSRIGSEVTLGEWYLPDQPVDPSLFEEEEECSSQALMLHGNELINTTLKHMLLFDLINEVLLQIYDTSFAYCPDFRIRPVPVGHRVLEEVWAVISQHLSHQLLLDQTVESTVARDFMKNDGWMDLKHDTEFVGLDMEDWILEELVEEIILDFDDIWIEKIIVDYDDISDLEFLAYQLEG
ncbi:hypothetical protein ZIOFF_055745 [Zingiber officinale]|uniref:DUF4378 domain-containing protein n=2 Tax=Zingiber officinale TaxID=94328 RepID=A0A8J5FMP4_ZINOF|nr:hypothetical protein ZIOFF_055745 [Zingiber officinale]